MASRQVRIAWFCDCIVQSTSIIVAIVVEDSVASPWGTVGNSNAIVGASVTSSSSSSRVVATPVIAKSSARSASVTPAIVDVRTRSFAARVLIIGSVVASRASIAPRLSRGWESPSSQAVPSVWSSASTSEVSKNVPAATVPAASACGSSAASSRTNMFCEGGEADGATVARLKEWCCVQPLS